MPSATKQALRPRPVPQRTCVACGTTSGKRDLIRIVRGVGEVRPDPTGKLPGRGAYLCVNPACWELALKKKKLDHSLKVKLTAEDNEAIAAFAGALAPSEVV